MLWGVILLLTPSFTRRLGYFTETLFGIRIGRGEMVIVVTNQSVLSQFSPLGIPPVLLVRTQPPPLSPLTHNVVPPCWKGHWWLCSKIGLERRTQTHTQHTPHRHTQTHTAHTHTTDTHTTHIDTPPQTHPTDTHTLDAHHRQGHTHTHTQGALLQGVGGQLSLRGCGSLVLAPDRTAGLT